MCLQCYMLHWTKLTSPYCSPSLQIHLREMAMFNIIGCTIRCIFCFNRNNKLWSKCRVCRKAPLFKFALDFCTQHWCGSLLNSYVLCYRRDVMSARMMLWLMSMQLLISVMSCEGRSAQQNKPRHGTVTFL